MIRGIRRIDFQKLWRMIGCNVNPETQNEWSTYERFPVPVWYWNDRYNQFWLGFILLPIQLHAPKRGGVCRFSVEAEFKGVSLARLLQSNVFKDRANELLIYDNIEDPILDLWGIEEDTDDYTKDLAHQVIDQLANAIQCPEYRQLLTPQPRT